MKFHEILVREIQSIVAKSRNPKKVRKEMSIEQHMNRMSAKIPVFLVKTEKGT